MSTAVDDLLATVTGETTEGPTIRNGRYSHVHPVTGDATTSQRVTNFTKLLSDAYRIQQWEKRMVLLGAAMRPDLTAQAIAAGAEDRQALDKLAGEAKEAAGGNRGANLGSAMHDLTDRVDRGEEVPVPAPLDADLAAYRDALASHDVRIRRDLIERHVCLPDLGVAGRFDRIVDHHGALKVADLKTGAHLEFLEIAIQLALYAHAEWMWDAAVGCWVRKPAVDLAEALVVHLPAGKATCRLYAVDIAAGWEAVQEADRVRQWRRRSKSLARALDTAGADDLEQLLAEPPAAVAHGREVLDRVRANMAARPGLTYAGALDDNPRPPVEVDPALVAEASAGLRLRLQAALSALGDVLPPGIAWPAGVPKYRDGGPTTWGHCKAVEAFLAELEKVTQAPFCDVLPDDPTVPRRETFAGKPVTMRPTPAVTPAEVLDELRERFAAIAPADIRQAATARARELGVADVERLTAPQVASLRAEVVEVAEIEWEARKGYLASRLQGWGDDDVACLVHAAAGDTPLEALRVDHVEKLDSLLDALDGDVLKLVLDDAGVVHLVAAPAAEARLALRSGGKAGLLNLAKAAADRLGRPRPRSAAQAVADPVLVAALALPPGSGGDEDTTTSTNQGAAK